MKKFISKLYLMLSCATIITFINTADQQKKSSPICPDPACPGAVIKTQSSNPLINAFSSNQKGKIKVLLSKNLPFEQLKEALDYFESQLKAFKNRGDTEKVNEYRKIIDIIYEHSPERHGIEKELYTYLPEKGISEIIGGYLYERPKTLKEIEAQIEKIYEDYNKGEEEYAKEYEKEEKMPYQPTKFDSSIFLKLHQLNKNDLLEILKTIYGILNIINEYKTVYEQFNETTKPKDLLTRIKEFLTKEKVNISTDNLYDKILNLNLIGRYDDHIILFSLYQYTYQLVKQKWDLNDQDLKKLEIITPEEIQSKFKILASEQDSKSSSGSEHEHEEA